VGYTTRYTVAVWVGNFSGEPMHDVSGVDGAAPVWREIMDFLHEGSAPERPGAPPGLVHTRVTYASAFEPAREEWFIAGTESAVVRAIDSGTVSPRIESPANGAIYAIDPDIPRERQRVVVAARGAPPGARLVVQGAKEARADQPLLWLPEPGLRTIVLTARDGRELDRVRIEVRGIRPPRATPNAP
jgi:penicillin-binding protein 1C